MEPGDEDILELAVLTAFGEDHLDSITELRNITEEVRGIREALFTPASVPPVPNCPVVEDPTYALEVRRSHPEPAASRTTFEFVLPDQATVRMRVFDALGREVAMLVDGVRDAGPQTVTFDVSALAQGVYYARLEIEGLEGAAPITVTEPFTVIR